MKKLKSFLILIAILFVTLISVGRLRVNAITPGDNNSDLTLKLEQQENVDSTSGDVANIRYICTLENVTDLSGITDLKINFFRYKYGNKAYKASVDITRVYDSIANESSKTKKDYTYYAVYLLRDVDNEAYQDWTITASFSACGIVSNEISYTINDSGDDFIYSMDASAVPSLENVGIKYYDFDGNEADVFRILADNGINYIRVRIWNNPYDTNGNPYGGGNTDLENAIKIGKRASKYGMKLLVDFHYSDFWADPGKQNLPKEWASYSKSQIQDAIYSYTYQSLETLIKNNIDIGMVQVGNETNDAMAGSEGESTMATVCSYMSKGSAAVRKIASDYNKDILVALHFANPSNVGTYKWFASELSSNNVDYDVFGTSYYPYWHGSITNLTGILTNIATTYNKKVMVLETSYANCEMVGDYLGSDGSANTVYTREYELPGEVSDSGADENAFLPYSFTVNGQRNQILTVIAAIASIKNSTTQYGIGVSYWEGTWIGAYQALSVNGGTYSSYNDVWATGCGWTTSYAKSYDSVDYNVTSHGGCSVENEAFFRYDGTPYESLKLWRTKWNEAENVINGVDYNGANIVNSGFENSNMDGWIYTDGNAWPSTSYYYEGSYGCQIKGSEDYIYQDISGSYGQYTFSLYVMGNTSASLYIYASVNGVITKTSVSPSGSWSNSGFTKASVTFTCKDTDTVYVGIYAPSKWYGYIDNAKLELLTTQTSDLVNGSWENDWNASTGWTLSNSTGISIKSTESGSGATGDHALNYYSTTGVDFTLSQDVSGNAGSYTFSIDNYCASTAVITIFVTINGVTEEVTIVPNTTFSTWSSASISFTCKSSDTVIVGIKVTDTSTSAWGWLDNAILTKN